MIQTQDRRKILVARSTVVAEMMERRGIAHVLDGIDTTGFWFAIQSQQMMGALIEELFLKWPDVIGVYVEWPKHDRTHLVIRMFPERESVTP